jgi:hypothetical protein
VSGGGALGGDVVARLMEAVKGLESLVAGISGGGPGGKPGQVAGDAGAGAGQVGQQTGQVQQQGQQVQQGGEHGHGHGHGHRHGKPGWGNGGDGPPGLLKKQGMSPGQGLVDAAREQPSTKVEQADTSQVAGVQQQSTTQVDAAQGPIASMKVDPKSFTEVAAPEGAPTTDKSGARIRYFVHPGDPTPRPMSEAMLEYFGIGG